ncbi:hypothetical protein ACLK1W_19765 [Escherichia coli]
MARVKLAVYGLCGMLSALAGLIVTFPPFLRPADGRHGLRAGRHRRRCAGWYEPGMQVASWGP